MSIEHSYIPEVRVTNNHRARSLLHNRIINATGMRARASCTTNPTNGAGSKRQAHIVVVVSTSGKF